MVAQIDSAYVKARPVKLLTRLLSYSLFEGRPLTTKGRWINPLVFSLFALEKFFPVAKQVKKPIFIIGTGRSGTTILGIVLSIHRDIAFLNEPKALWNSAYDGEDLIGSYNRGDATYRLDAEDASSDVIQAMHRMFGWYLTVTGAQRVADKYPELIFRVPFVRAIFPDAKFLFLARNGWDTCNSIEQWSGRLGKQHKCGEVHDWWGVDNRKWKLLVKQIVSNDPGLSPYSTEIAGFTKHLDMAAVEWIVTMREGLHLQKQYPDAVHTVVYEKLTTNTKEVMEEICKFCELPPDSVLIDYACNTLHPVLSKPSFELHPIIQNEFDSVMHDLGYENGS